MRVPILPAAILLTVVCVIAGVEFSSQAAEPALSISAPEVTAASSGADASYQTAAAAVGPQDWFIENVDFTSCHKSNSPAERIQEIRNMGREARVEDTTDAGIARVEVGYSINAGLEETYETYYHTLADCESALAARNAIPDKYR
jgi:hypothetical protein